MKIVYVVYTVYLQLWLKCGYMGVVYCGMYKCTLEEEDGKDEQLLNMMFTFNNLTSNT